jgi:transcriptional regulator with XRE-family HTH domain
MQITTGNDIRAERARRKMSQGFLSKLTGYRREEIGAIENSRLMPTQEVLDDIRSAFEQFDNRQVAA